MAFFDDVSKKFSEATKNMAASTKNMTETVKINSAISDERKKMTDLYQKLGEAYYVKFQENPDPELAELTNSIKESIDRIVNLRDDLQKLKGVRVCPGCGAEISSDVAFCGKCGYKMDQEQ